MRSTATTTHLAWLFTTVTLLGASSLLAVDPPRTPNPESLQTGDFLWPKVPDKVVPFNSQPGVATGAEREDWEAGRAAELKRMEALPHPTADEKERYQALAVLTYDQFLSTYLTDQPEGATQPFGAIGFVATGHVAIVELRGDVPWIIEAMLHKGIQTMSYADWLRGRPGEWVWHGRLKNATGAQRLAIAAAARTEVGKPYDFWNFDLADEAGFYCSKLAWFSVWKATDLALDDKPGHRRALWFSPKRMMHSGHIQLLFDPGSY